MPVPPDGQSGAAAEEIPSLNGLRAISIILVIIGHAASAGAASESVVRRLLFDHAGLGVRVFFVISGYLITTLLLRERRLVGQVSLGRFYIRRALRILPAFYAYVICVVVLALRGVISLPPHNLLYVLTYTINFSPAGTWWTGHLWSLSVEEQFYLLWPLAIRFLRLRQCVAIAIAAVVAGIAIRGLAVVAGIELIAPALRYAFPFVSGSIAMGCLLAIAEAWRGRARRLTPIAASPLLAIVGLGLVLVLDTWDLGTWNRLTGIVADAILTFLVARVVYIPSDGVGRLLNSRPAVFVGQLSYSLYLWQQLFFQQYTNWAAGRFPWNLTATVAAACASYFLLERPFRRLRRRFRPAPRAIRDRRAIEPKDREGHRAKGTGQREVTG